jgi:hypothetical protein
MDLSDNTEHPDFYTWLQFKNEVQALMPQDANRLGMQDYLPRLIREAVIDLQQFIPSYRKRHESLYFPTDFVAEGAASVGTLPPQSELTGAWLFRNATQQRYDIEMCPWERRFDLVHGDRHELGCDNQFMSMTTASVQAIELLNRLPQFRGKRERYGLIAPDPQGDSFYLYPAMCNGWILSLHWNGRKLDFRDDELVPFEETASFAAAAWAKSKIAGEVDRDAERAQMFMQEYELKRVNLYIENNAKAFIQR